MKNFINLTMPNGSRFIANIRQITRVINSPGKNRNENTYIGGVTNNGGIYVKESYDIVLKLIEEAL
jgi:hypothetical protein